MSLRKIAGLLVVSGLVLGLIGGGVGAVFQDQVTATEDISVADFECLIVDATAGALIAGDQKSVSYTAPIIDSSAAGSAPYFFDVRNTGDINAVLTVSTSSVSAPFSIVGFPFAAVPLAPNATHRYNTGVQWTELGQVNAGTSGAVTWTVNCGEVPAPVTRTSSQLNFSSTGWGGWPRSRSRQRTVSWRWRSAWPRSGPPSPPASPSR